MVWFHRVPPPSSSTKSPMHALWVILVQWARAHLHWPLLLLPRQVLQHWPIGRPYTIHLAKVALTPLSMVVLPLFSLVFASMPRFLPRYLPYWPISLRALRLIPVCACSDIYSKSWAITTYSCHLIYTFLHHNHTLL